MEVDLKHWIASLFLGLAASIAQAGTDRAFELDGTLAFASATRDQYLLAYSSAEIDSGPNIYGRVLNLDGSPSGKDFRLSRQTGAMSKPVIAYNPTAKRF